MRHRRARLLACLLVVAAAAACSSPENRSGNASRSPSPQSVGPPTSPGPTAGSPRAPALQTPSQPAYGGTAVAGVAPGHATPAAAYAGWLDAQVAGNVAVACTYVLPSLQPGCPEEMSKQTTTVRGSAIRIGATDIVGTQALVVPIGTICLDTNQCLTNTDPNAGIPATPANFGEAYLQATGTQTDPAGGFQEVKGLWYLDLGGTPVVAAPV